MVTRTVQPRPATTPERRGSSRALALLLALLGVLVATVPVLGPLVTEVLVYRTSPTTLNQLEGADAAALLVVTPTCLAAAWLVHRRHPVGSLLATGVAVYALYTSAQVVIGQEYLRVPGNVERFFPLLLALFVTAEAVLVLAWWSVPAPLPEPSRRLRRATGWLLLGVAAFLVVGLHLPTLVTAWTDPTALTQYASSPTPFWMVKLMDLGIVVPAAVAVGTGLLRRAGWAVRAAFPLLTGYTLLAWSVASMAIVMLSSGDPDASPALTAGFVGFAAGLTAATAAFYRPLGTPDRVDAASGPGPQGRPS